MFKKLFLALVAFSFLALPGFAFAQEARELTVPLPTDYDYSVTSDYTTDYNWDSLTAEEQDAVTQAATGVAALGAGVMIFVIGFSAVVGLASYIYSSFALMTVGNKIGIKDSWFVWVPILNFVFFAKVANINPWLFLLILVPGVNAFFLFYVMIVSFMNMSEKRGLDKMLGLLVLIPLVNYIFMGYLAWAKITPKAVAQPVAAA